MKVITKDKTVSFSNSDSCYGNEFQFEDKNLNIAVATVKGRYPAKGHLINQVCTEVAYVISGSGKIGVDAELHDLNPGDAVHITAGERFFWQGHNLKLLIPCSPAFYPEQHLEVA